MKEGGGASPSLAVQGQRVCPRELGRTSGPLDDQPEGARADCRDERRQWFGGEMWIIGETVTRPDVT
jgi:hypothetical protein